MPTVPAGLVVPLNDDGNGTPAIGFRRALALLFQQSSPGVAAPGRLGSNHFQVTGHATLMRYVVSPGGIVLVRSTAGGAYVVGIPDAVEVPTAAADGVNPRIDRIYCKQPDPALDGSAVGVDFIIDVVSGLPASTPEAPALPSGAFELARKVIAPGATNTAAGAAFTDVAAVTGLNLGVVPISAGGTGANTVEGARNALGFFIQPTAPAYADNRVFIKVPA